MGEGCELVDEEVGRRTLGGMNMAGKQADVCTGRQVHFPFRNFTIDHVVPESRGGTGHIENLQLLCAACNSEKGDKPMSVLLERLMVKGVLR